MPLHVLSTLFLDNPRFLIQKMQVDYVIDIRARKQCQAKLFRKYGRVTPISECGSDVRHRGLLREIERTLSGHNANARLAITMHLRL